MNLLNNPEFRRNLWLEMSPQRLIITPVLIAIFLFVTVVAVGEKKDTVWLLTTTSLACFFMLMLWGGRNARNTLSEEGHEGTWDGQRMSTISPWQMTWGKLFGATLGAWYGGMIFLGVLVFALLSLEKDVYIFAILTNLICIALIIHALAMLSVLLAWHKSLDKKPRSGIGILGIIIVLCLYFSFFGNPYSALSGSLSLKIVVWWGMEWNRQYLFSLFLALLAAWAIIGVWQAMRREMLRRNPPGIWLFFQIFWFFVLVGLCRDKRELVDFLWGATGVLGVWAYLLFLGERKDGAAWLRLGSAWRKRDWQQIGHLTPACLSSFLLVQVTCASAALLSDVPAVAVLLINIGWLGLILRDVAWILRLNLAPNTRHPEAAALISLFFAYAILPWLMVVVLSRPMLLGGEALFWPPLFPLLTAKLPGSWSFYPVTYALAASLQAALVLWLLYWRLKNTRLTM